MKNLLDVKNLKISFFTNQGLLYAVRGISFDLAEGEVLGIAGESGSGKSVTAHSILGLLPDNLYECTGDILFNNQNLLKATNNELKAVRGKGISMIFQEPGRSFDPLYSIEKTLTETIKTHHPELSKDEITKRSIKLLQEVRIPEAASRIKNFPHQFSGGMLQRIMIALALASDPKILIADEPTTSLDVTIQAEIINLLMELKEKRNLSIIFISHDISLLANIADRIMVVYAGIILESGSVEQVLFHPHHPYTRALLDSTPQLGDHYSQKTLFTIPGSVPNPLKPETGCPFASRCSMVQENCLIQIPEIIQEPQFYRCIFKGEK